MNQEHFGLAVQRMGISARREYKRLAFFFENRLKAPLRCADQIPGENKKKENRMASPMQPKTVVQTA